MKRSTAIMVLAVALVATTVCDARAEFGGEATTWHGFARYDFLMNESDLGVKPYKAAPDEGDAVRAQVPGHLRCVVVAPKQPAAGNPWSWQGYYWNHEPQTEVELLKRGFHIVTGPVPTYTDGPVLEQWNALYKHLTDAGLSKTPVLAGAGGAAGEAYAWAIENPDKVACLYAENPILRSHMTKAEPLDRLDVLAKAGVPVLYVCGTLDPWLASQTRVLEERYKALGGKVTVIVEEGKGHFPTAPRDPDPVVEFILARQPAVALDRSTFSLPLSPLSPQAVGYDKASWFVRQRSDLAP